MVKNAIKFPVWEGARQDPSTSLSTFVLVPIKLHLAIKTGNNNVTHTADSSRIET
jgi:hypothetical protein